MLFDDIPVFDTTEIDFMCKEVEVFCQHEYDEEHPRRAVQAPVLFTQTTRNMRSRNKKYNRLLELPLVRR